MDNRTIKIVGNSIIEYSKIDGKNLKWEPVTEDPLYQGMLKNMGIGSINPMYLETNEIQEKDYEYRKIVRFLGKYIDRYAEKHDVSVDDLQLKFINYGKTELVYVLTEKGKSNRVTLLVKQPAVQFGRIKNEAQNLVNLKNSDSNVVAPIDYFQFGDQELFATPYINQARCIAALNGSWGMYIPEPMYRFVSFDEKQERVVNSCMIAKLVSLYNFTKQEGISGCQLGGGDFMLPKWWETEPPSIKNTLNNLYLIAARRKVHCSFDDYLAILRDEFSRATISENKENLIVNIRSRAPMQNRDIEFGIRLGKAIIQSKKSQSNSNKVKSCNTNTEKKEDDFEK